MSRAAPPETYTYCESRKISDAESNAISVCPASDIAGIRTKTPTAIKNVKQLFNLWYEKSFKYMNNIMNAINIILLFIITIIRCLYK